MRRWSSTSTSLAAPSMPAGSRPTSVSLDAAHAWTEREYTQRGKPQRKSEPRITRAGHLRDILGAPKGVTPMEQQKPKIPAEAIELYNRYIHGEISRRDFLEGAKRFAIAGVAATAIIDALMPNYALGQRVSKTDERIKGTYETVQSPNGNGSIKGYLVRPFSADTRSETPTKLPGVLVVHENRGLNPHIEDIARRFALENFMAFAPDGLTSVGGSPGDDYKGSQMFSKVDGAKRTQDFLASAQWLKSRPDSTGKIGATGFCFGGGMANTLSVLMGPEMAAVAPYYGGAPKPEDVPRIKAAMLIRHGGAL